MPLITPTTQFQIGKTLFPITTSLVNTALFDVDKPVAYLLDFTAACIQRYVGPRFTLQCNAANIKTFPSGIIGSTLPYNPVPYLQEEGLKFPILACWRGAFKVYEADISQHRVETTLHWLYIWQPLNAGHMEILSPFLDGVKNVIIDRNEYGNDASYNDGYTIATAAGYDSLGVTQGERLSIAMPGANVATQLPFESVYTEMTLKEINTAIVGQFIPTTGIDGYMTLIEENEAPWENFEDFQSTP